MRVAVGLMSGFSFGHALVVQAKQLFHPNELQDLDAAPCGIKVNSGNVPYG